MTEIRELASPREGIAFAFRGQEPDADGNPTGEVVTAELVVPPLNFDAIRRMQAELKKLGGGDVAAFETLAVVLERALSRNYSGVPQWLIAQTIDVANMQDFISAVMDVSGLKRKEVEAGKAAATTSVSTGTSSTPT